MSLSGHIVNQNQNILAYHYVLESLEGQVNSSELQPIYVVSHICLDRLSLNHVRP